MRKHRPMLRPNRRNFMAGVAGVAGVAAGFRFQPYGAAADEEKKLNFYNWDTYIGETTLDDFKEASGIDTKMTLFADNDELFAKLKEGNPGFDLIVPTNDYVEQMLAAKMLQPIDHSKIPNMSNLEPAFQDATFDPGRKHSVPYMWGTIGIGYNKEEVEGVPASWKWLYDSDKYEGRIALLGDGGTVIGHALKYLGYSLNATDPAEIKKGEELIIANKDNIQVFADDNGQDLLVSGEVDLAQEWNGDILQVMDEDEDDIIDYVVPTEGGVLWQDCLCMPNDAPHPENAHAFMNFVLDPKVGAAIADFIQYASPNAAAKAIMEDSYTKNLAIFPTEETLANCEASLYQGEDVKRLYDEAWTRIQAA